MPFAAVLPFIPEGIELVGLGLAALGIGGAVAVSQQRQKKRQAFESTMTPGDKGVTISPDKPKQPSAQDVNLLPGATQNTTPPDTINHTGHTKPRTDEFNPNQANRIPQADPSVKNHTGHGKTTPPIDPSKPLQLQATTLPKDNPALERGEPLPKKEISKDDHVVIEGVPFEKVRFSGITQLKHPSGIKFAGESTSALRIKEGSSLYHIVERHTTFGNALSREKKSVFNASNTEQLIKLLTEAWSKRNNDKYSQSHWVSQGDKKFYIVNMNKYVGQGADGKPKTRIQIRVDRFGNVVTAFPD